MLETTYSYRKYFKDDTLQDIKLPADLFKLNRIFCIKVLKIFVKRYSCQNTLFKKYLSKKILYGEYLENLKNIDCDIPEIKSFVLDFEFLTLPLVQTYKKELQESMDKCLQSFEFSCFENLNDMCLALKEHLARFFYLQKSKISNNDSEKLTAEELKERKENAKFYLGLMMKYFPTKKIPLEFGTKKLASKMTREQLIEYFENCPDKTPNSNLFNNLNMANSIVQDFSLLKNTTKP